MGRHSIGKRPMTAAERQRRHRRGLSFVKGTIKGGPAGVKADWTLADDRAELVAAMKRVWHRIHETVAAFERAMGNLKTIHEAVGDMSWDEFVQASFGISGKAADHLIAPSRRERASHDRQR